MKTLVVVLTLTLLASASGCAMPRHKGAGVALNTVLVVGGAAMMSTAESEAGHCNNDGCDIYGAAIADGGQILVGGALLLTGVVGALLTLALPGEQKNPAHPTLGAPIAAVPTDDDVEAVTPDTFIGDGLPNM